MLHLIGYYRFKDENGIIFNAYKTKAILTTDYDQFLIKKFVNEYIEKEKKKTIICKEEFDNYKGYEFLKFSFGIKINDYSQIEETVKELMEVNSFINKKAKKIFTSATMPVPIYYPEIYLNDFVGKIGHDIKYYDDEYYTKKIKIDYINYLHQNNIEDVNVPNEDLLDYYKPEEFIVCVNGKNVKINRNNQDINVFSTYSIKKGDYFIQLHYIIKNMKNVDDYEFNQSGKLLSFIYKGQEYILDPDLNLKSEIKGNKVPYEWTISKLAEFFDGEAKYDYENKTINLNI